MAETNVGLPDDRRVALRVGVNLGDVVVEDGDSHGDGANDAARLERSLTLRRESTSSVSQRTRSIPTRRRGAFRIFDERKTEKAVFVP